MHADNFFPSIRETWELSQKLGETLQKLPLPLFCVEVPTVWGHAVRHLWLQSWLVVDRMRTQVPGLKLTPSFCLVLCH